MATKRDAQTGAARSRQDFAVGSERRDHYLSYRGMLVAWLQRYSILTDVGRFDTQHAGPLVVAEVGHARTLLGPGVPHDRRLGSAFSDRDVPRKNRILQATSVRRIEVDAVCFSAKGNHPIAGWLYLATIDFVDVGNFLQTLDGDSIDSADRKVGMQRVFKTLGLRMRRWQMSRQGQRQHIAERNNILQVEWGDVRGACYANVLIGVDLDRCEFPLLESRQAMRGLRFVTGMRTEPWETDWHATTNWFVALKVRVLAQPENGRFSRRLPRCAVGSMQEELAAG